mmetsp:Transcript_35700/g.102869  ORF Transcript_35700/g.102869 Transcript_35700/m.102869 type:complete len:340 (-) Transcript_35700:143-1162(-)
MWKALGTTSGTRTSSGLRHRPSRVAPDRDCSVCENKQQLASPNLSPMLVADLPAMSDVITGIRIPVVQLGPDPPSSGPSPLERHLVMSVKIAELWGIRLPTTLIYHTTIKRVPTEEIMAIQDSDKPKPTKRPLRSKGTNGSNNKKKMDPPTTREPATMIIASGRHQVLDADVVVVSATSLPGWSRTVAQTTNDLQLKMLMLLQGITRVLHPCHPAILPEGVASTEVHRLLDVVQDEDAESAICPRGWKIMMATAQVATMPRLLAPHTMLHQLDIQRVVHLHPADRHKTTAAQSLPREVALLEEDVVSVTSQHGWMMAGTTLVLAEDRLLLLNTMKRLLH